MVVPTIMDSQYKKTRRGTRGKRHGGVRTKIPRSDDQPHSGAAFTETILGQSKTFSPVGGNAWLQAHLGRDLAEAINTDEVTMEHRRMILEHPQMAAAMLIFAAFLASNRWKIKCDEPRIKAFAQALLKPIWRKLIRSMLKGVFFGYVPFERRYKLVSNLNIRDDETDEKFRIKNALMYQGLKSLPPDAVELWVDRDRYGGFSQKKYGIQRLEPEETFWYAHDMDQGKLHGCPRVTRGTRDFWVYNIIMWQNLMRYGTRIASPPIKGHAPDGYRRKRDPDTGQTTLWQPIQTLHNNARGLQESGILIMPFEESPSGKQKFEIDYLTDPTPSAQRLTGMITESGHMMLYSVLLPPQMFQSLTPGRGQGYGSISSLGGLAAEGVDEIMADIADAIENGDELYGIPSVLQEPIKKTFGPDAAHAYLEPVKTSRNRAALLADLLGTGIRAGVAGVDFDALADELGVAAGISRDIVPGKVMGKPPNTRGDDRGPGDGGRVQIPAGE